jgi:hypothetical protein
MTLFREKNEQFQINEDFEKNPICCGYSLDDDNWDIDPSSQMEWTYSSIHKENEYSDCGKIEILVATNWLVCRTADGLKELQQWHFSFKHFSIDSVFTEIKHTSCYLEDIKIFENSVRKLFPEYVKN